MTIADERTAGMAAAPRLDPRQRPKPVHGYGFGLVSVIEHYGLQMAYFPRTGDLARITGPMAEALRMFQVDVGWDNVRDVLRSRFGDAEADEAIGEIEALVRSGYLAPDEAESETEQQEYVDLLLATRPRKLMLLVTEACNLGCKYCYEVANAYHDTARMMRPEHMRSVLDRFFEESLGRSKLDVTFFGGEPLLNFRGIKQGVDYSLEKAEELGVEVGFCMTTNLTLMTEEIADYLVEHRFAVMVSIDGDREGHNLNRITKSGEGTYDTVVANLKMLLEKQAAAGVRPAKLRATLTKGNKDVLHVRQHLRSLGTDLIMLGESHGTAFSREAWDITHEEAMEIWEDMDARVHAYLEDLEHGRDTSHAGELLAYFTESLVRIHREVARKEPIHRPEVQLCGVCRNMKAVTPGGQIYPCHRYVGMPAYVMGSTTEGLDEAKVSNYYARLHDVFESKCRNCWAKVLCGGQCPWHLSKPDGEFVLPDEDSCQGIRGGLSRSMALYAVLVDRFPAAFEELTGISASRITGNGQGDLVPLVMPDEICGS